MRAFAPLLIALLSLQAACATFDRRFPLAEPMWQDPDRNHVEHTPKEYYSGLAWDGADQTTFFPLSQALRVDPAFRSVNVNSMDEVPESSWWNHRAGMKPFSVEEARRGACSDDVLPDEPPWTVVATKPNGQTPGFIVSDASGRIFVLKTDGLEQPYRASMSDVFGSRLYHAAGYNAPCNLVVHITPDDLVIGEDTEVEQPLGGSRPMVRDDIAPVLDKAVLNGDGTRRLAASMFVQGTPLGPFTYQGLRKDDPNDAIRHQDRRELRGGRVLASWMHHFDTREQNSLDMLVEEDGKRYVRHYYIDFGDGFGWYWINDGFSRRYGHSYYLDVKDIALDFITLGAKRRPWETVSEDETVPWLGYFDVEHFDPATWKGGYRNPAFERMQPDDAAWMARIIARLEGPHVRAMLQETQIDPAAEDYVFDVLMQRRHKLLDVWLAVASPLTDFEVSERGLCFEDLRQTTGVADGPVVYPIKSYLTSFRSPAAVDPAPGAERLGDGRTCVSLDGVRRPRTTPDMADDDPRRYLVLDVLVRDVAAGETLPPARLHFYDLGERRGLRLVGIERPGRVDAPVQ